MKKIGLIGGMSWKSSLEYYRVINEMVQQNLGGLHSAETIMYSVDFAEIEAMQRSDQWEQAARVLAEAARKLEQAGAGLLLICANTMHKVFDEVESAVRIPVLHIADAVAEAVRAQEISVVGLLGTRFTMEQEFLKERLRRYGIDTVVPQAEERDYVHRIVFEELCQGCIRDESRKRVLEIIDDLAAAGAKGVILGCTELPLLIKPEDVDLPLFDTVYLHALQAVGLALVD